MTDCDDCNKPCLNPGTLLPSSVSSSFAPQSQSWSLSLNCRCHWSLSSSCASSSASCSSFSSSSPSSSAHANQTQRCKVQNVYFQVLEFQNPSTALSHPPTPPPRKQWLQCQRLPLLHLRRTAVHQRCVHPPWGLPEQGCFPAHKPHCVSQFTSTC